MVVVPVVILEGLITDKYVFHVLYSYIVKRFSLKKIKIKKI